MFSKAGDFSPSVVLGIVAHPDDMEFIAGGSIARWIKAGATVHYLVLTNGNRGANRPTTPKSLRSTRQQEQRQAADILGVSELMFADYDDCCLENCEAVKKDIVRAIRRLRPDTIITIDPTLVYCAEQGYINHPDHRAAGQATLDAVFPLARDQLSFPELITDEQLQPHEVTNLLLFNLNQANFYVDITDTISTKLLALAAHRSQFTDNQQISAKVHDLAVKNGSQCDTDCAESFMHITIS